MPKYWGHECDFLTKSLFRVLSEAKQDAIQLSRVYFHQFIEKFYMALTLEVLRDRMKFCFKMIDTDGDGVINGTDLKRCVELVNMDSKFGIEL